MCTSTKYLFFSISLYVYSSNKFTCETSVYRHIGLCWEYDYARRRRRAWKVLLLLLLLLHGTLPLKRLFYERIFHFCVYIKISLSHFSFEFRIFPSSGMFFAIEFLSSYTYIMFLSQSHHMRTGLSMPSDEPFSPHPQFVPRNRFNVRLDRSEKLRVQSDGN